MKPHTELQILLVEDNPCDAELALRALKIWHSANHIVWVKDGAEALDLLLGANGNGPAPKPKVILLDLKLPKVDGLEVLRQLKAATSTRTIPVVLLTSSREERDVARAYDLGANSYIVKPVGFDSYSEVVSQLGRYWLTLNQPPEAPPASLLVA
jgi:CheY-like chemotaxis protein